MRVLFDLTENGIPGDFNLPDPGSIALEGDDVVIAFGEVEVRMTFPQVLSFSEAIRHWIFRDCRGTKDLNDPDHCDDEEHERLRTIFRKLLDHGTEGGAPTTREMMWWLEAELRRQQIDVGSWVSRDDELLRLRAEVDTLRAEAEKRSRKPRAR